MKNEGSEMLRKNCPKLSQYAYLAIFLYSSGILQFFFGSSISFKLTFIASNCSLQLIINNNSKQILICHNSLPLIINDNNSFLLLYLIIADNSYHPL